ncbi:MAG: ECF transporter S component, partial [Clostridia bacterium]|nr:ECF transporter S component [Clostridia bacterium]
MKRIKGSLAAYALLVLICLAVNWGGDQIVSRLNWPVWLDSIGTVVCAYIAGPFCGVVVGITTNLLAHILYGIPWFYAIVSVVIA